MRVLHVISSIERSYGGPASALVGLSVAQKECGLDPFVVTAPCEPNAKSYLGDLRENGIDVFQQHCPTRPRFFSPGSSRQIADLVRHAKVVHVHGLWEGLQYQSVSEAVRQSRPYIIRPCGMLTRWSLAQRKWKKRAYRLWRLNRMLRHAAAIHFTTSMEELSSRKVLPPFRSFLEPNGYLKSDYEQSTGENDFRRKVGLSPLDRYALFVGRLHAVKGVDVLIRAMGRLADKSVKLLVVGSGSQNYTEQLRALSEEVGVAARVIFAGMLSGSDKVASYRYAEFFVLPSYHENFGNVVIESLVSGTPVIISDHVGLADAVSAAGVGKIVSVCPDAIADAMDQWMMDRGLKEVYASRLVDFVQNYEWASIAQRWATHYQNISSLD